MKGYKDILVLLDETTQLARTQAAAIDLAAALGARLGALCATAEARMPPWLISEIDSELVARFAAERGARVEGLRDGFLAACKAAGVPCHWSQLTAREDELVRIAARRARCCDLLVVGQPDADYAGEDASRVQTLIMSSGRPVLVVPYVGIAARPGERILVAWDGSREAARAIGDALPLLERATAVDLFMIGVEPLAEEDGGEPGLAMERHLKQHGVPVRLRRVDAGGLAVGDHLLNRVSDEGHDLVVMGAYAHSRLRDLVLGGATRSLLRHMTVPVLMSH